MVEVGPETQVIGELGQMQCDYKPHLPLKMKPGMIHYLLIQVYCYARFGKIAPIQTEMDFLAAFMLHFNLLNLICSVRQLSAHQNYKVKHSL